MNKTLSALICTLALLTFSAQAQAATIDWTVNIGFVADSLTDGLTGTGDYTSGTDVMYSSIAWDEKVSRPILGDFASTGTVTGGEKSGSISVYPMLNLFPSSIVPAPLFSGSGNLIFEASATMRFDFTFTPSDGHTGEATSVTFDVNFDINHSIMGLTTLSILDINSENNGIWIDDNFYVLTLEAHSTFMQPSFTITAAPADAPNPTPEPATMLLMGVGLAGLGFAARRRAKTSK